MENITSATIRKSASLFLICTLFFLNLSAQQYIIADKDNTHPEVKTSQALSGFITKLAAERANGYNEIAWTALREDDVRKYIVEYSTNGLDFQSAGEVVPNNGVYVFRHHLMDNSPAIYRIKTEHMNNRFFYSDGIFLVGSRISPVKIFPTVVYGNIVNIDSYWPVEKVNVIASNGAKVYSQDLNGQRDKISIVLPSLGKGMYWMAFQGRGWRTTEKFIVE